MDAQTQLVGLIGWPVAHSLSPEMHNAAFAYAGINWRYVPLPVQAGQLHDALRGLIALGFRGANVTVPHKVDVIPLLDSITEAVTIVGAVNTIRIDRQTGRLEGLNTDMTGFLADLAANNVRIVKDSRVVVLGAGGAARAVGAALLRCGAQVTFVNRTPGKSESLVGFLKSSWTNNKIWHASIEFLGEVAADATLIVNTTSAGMWPDIETSPWPEGVPFPKEAILYDTIYRPMNTRLMRDAEKAGLRVLGGIGMLVYQGASSFEMWTGRKPPIDVMKMICQQKLTMDEK
jgi:shikimate dehydrogenase